MSEVVKDLKQKIEITRFREKNLGGNAHRIELLTPAGRFKPLMF